MPLAEFRHGHVKIDIGGEIDGSVAARCIRALVIGKLLRHVSVRVVLLVGLESREEFILVPLDLFNAFLLAIASLHLLDL